jgi:hypothetical protein
MWDKNPLNLEFNLFPNEKPQFLLGYIALTKKFKRKSFTNEEVRSYLIDLFKKGIPVYGGTKGNRTPANIYYIRGLLERERISESLIYYYRVKSSIRKKIMDELKKTEYVNYLNQL